MTTVLPDVVPVAAEYINRGRFSDSGVHIDILHACTGPGQGKRANPKPPVPREKTTNVKHTGAYYTCVFTNYYGSAKVETRWCPGYAGIANVLLRLAPDFNNPRITQNVLNIEKHPGSNPDSQGSPRSCHGQAKDRQGFLTVSLWFFTDALGWTIRGDPASEPGQWDLCFRRQQFIAGGPSAHQRPPFYVRVLLILII